MYKEQEKFYNYLATSSDIQNYLIDSWICCH